jgi:hypothetical protein
MKDFEKINTYVANKKQSEYFNLELDKGSTYKKPIELLKKLTELYYGKEDDNDIVEVSGDETI